MNTNHKRKKQPEVVRAQLLDAAAQISVERGLPEITLDEVARKAGVSKGGLLHHFPSRQVLVESLFKELLYRFSNRINAFIDSDPNPKGRFSRAYIMAVTAPNDDFFESKLLGAAMLAMSMDSLLADIWSGWLRNQLEINGEEENSVTGKIVRYAADGMWLEDSISDAQPDEEMRKSVISRLVELTKDI